MEVFNQIPIWENKRRLKLLKEFRELLVLYFENSDYSWKAEGMIEKPLAKQTREQINRKFNQVYPVVILADVSPVMRWTPPALIGGYIQNVDTLLNIFNLHQYEISHDEVIGFLDRAVGTYEADQPRAWFRTFNPFWWLNYFLWWVSSLPFKFLRQLGFNKEKAEETSIGKVVKGIFYLIPLVAAFLTILAHMNWLEAFKNFWR